MTKMLLYVGIISCFLICACLIAPAALCLLSMGLANNFADKLNAR